MEGEEETVTLTLTLAEVEALSLAFGEASRSQLDEEYGPAPDEEIAAVQGVVNAVRSQLRGAAWWAFENGGTPTPEQLAQVLAYEAEQKAGEE